MPSLPQPVETFDITSVIELYSKKGRKKNHLLTLYSSAVGPICGPRQLLGPHLAPAAVREGLMLFPPTLFPF